MLRWFTCSWYFFKFLLQINVFPSLTSHWATSVISLLLEKWPQGCILWLSGEMKFLWGPNKWGYLTVYGHSREFDNFLKKTSIAQIADNWWSCLELTWTIPVKAMLHEAIFLATFCCETSCKKDFTCNTLVLQPATATKCCVASCKKSRNILCVACPSKPARQFCEN